MTPVARNVVCPSPKQPAVMTGESDPLLHVLSQKVGRSKSLPLLRTPLDFTYEVLAKRAMIFVGYACRFLRHGMFCTMTF